MWWKIPLALIIGLPVLLGACTPMQWVKPDTESALVDQDLADCRREASIRAFHESWHFQNFAPIIVHDHRGRVIFLRRDQPFSDPYFREFSLTNFCMQDKGYKLVPVKPAN